MSVEILKSAFEKCGDFEKKNIELMISKRLVHIVDDDDYYLTDGPVMGVDDISEIVDKIYLYDRLIEKSLHPPVYMKNCRCVLEPIQKHKSPNQEMINRDLGSHDHVEKDDLSEIDPPWNPMSNLLLCADIPER